MSSFCSCTNPRPIEFTYPENYHEKWCNHPDEPKILGTLQLINNGNGRVNTPNDTPTGYDGYLGIELRGSTSKDFFPKKPYGFELWADTTGKSQKVAFLGMPEESDWVLNASYNDKTFMRDALTYDISNRMGRYATRTRYCEITLNGRYDGLYLVMEKIKRDKNRVNISSIKTTDSTGDALTVGIFLKLIKSTVHLLGLGKIRLGHQVYFFR
jgi:hypothetical protein